MTRIRGEDEALDEEVEGEEKRERAQVLFYAGRFGNQNEKKLRLLHRAANLGKVSAMTYLGYVYKYLRGGTDAALKLAKEWYVRACEFQVRPNAKLRIPGLIQSLSHRMDII